MLSTPEIQLDVQSVDRSMRVREERPGSEREIGENVNQDNLRWFRVAAFS